MDESCLAFANNITNNALESFGQDFSNDFVDNAYKAERAEVLDSVRVRELGDKGDER